jgi:hypothetical protein
MLAEHDCLESLEMTHSGESESARVHSRVVDEKAARRISKTRPAHFDRTAMTTGAIRGAEAPEKPSINES